VWRTLQPCFRSACMPALLVRSVSERSSLGPQNSLLYAITDMRRSWPRGHTCISQALEATIRTQLTFANQNCTGFSKAVATQCGKCVMHTRPNANTFEFAIPFSSKRLCACQCCSEPEATPTTLTCAHLHVLCTFVRMHVLLCMEMDGG
jgi:hypothetical protein